MYLKHGRSAIISIIHSERKEAKSERFLSRMHRPRGKQIPPPRKSKSKRERERENHERTPMLIKN
jgi:hypothetical protein